jgi:SAM-dependent methyltransferase
MRFSVLSLLLCPNAGVPGFIAFGHAVEREGGIVHDLNHSQLVASDDIREGFVVNVKSNCVYPIRAFVLSLLNDEDAANDDFCASLSDAINYSPSDLRSAVLESLGRVRSGMVGSRASWNHGEMAYYDHDVTTPEARQKFLNAIASESLWHIYLERDKHLVSRLRGTVQTNLLEIGCGNARTIRSLFRPADHGYQYIGTDISLKRLTLAKAVVPEGDFVQCSAFNLPFCDNIFSAIVSFGVLHHLPDPLDGVREGARCLRSGGSFVIHEPLERARLLADKQLPLIQRMFRTYEHSEHDGSFDLAAAQPVISAAHLSVSHLHFSGSLLRTFSARLLQVLRLRHSRGAWQALIKLDQLFIRFFCATPNRFGPKAVYLDCVKSAT